MSYEQVRFGGYNYLPPVVKNLLIINGLFFLATIVLEKYDVNLAFNLGLFIPQSDYFRPYQLLTHMFMHGGLTHIAFNMFALWMFGNSLENYWGGKRFLIYYMATGLGAAALHLGVMELQYFSVIKDLSLEQLEMVKSEGLSILMNEQNYSDPILGKLNGIINLPTVGASGAVFGILLAFGMMFPEAQIYVYLLFPIRAKYFVVLYGLMELGSGLANRPGDNVAHFAHLGGMIFGFILIKYWQKRRFRF